MINKEKLTRMYDGIIEGNNELRTSQLNSYGFSSRDLKKLVYDGILKSIRKGYYTAISEKDFYDYADYLISIKRYKEAMICFEKCHEINPEYRDVNLRLFFNNIRNGKYEESLKYFDVLFHTNDKYQMKDNNCFLYLLSMIVDLPDKYQEYVRNLKYKDIEIPADSKNYIDIDSHNNLRRVLFNKEFEHAYKLSNHLHHIIFQDVLIRSLLIGIDIEQKRIEHYITGLAKDKKYEEIVCYLENMEKSRGYLKDLNKLCLIVAEELLRIKTSKEIPNPILFPTNNLIRSIVNKNYYLALSIQDKYIKSKGILPDTNALHILLTDINGSIEEIRRERRTKRTLENQEDLVVEKIEAVQEEIIESDSNFTIGVGIEQKRIEHYITGLAKDKKYEEIVCYLENMEKSCGYLKNSNKLCLIVAEELLGIKTSKVIPKSIHFPTHNLIQSIMNKNYYLALSIEDKYIKSKGISPDTNALHILLTDINGSIEEIRRERRTKCTLEHQEDLVVEKIEAVQEELIESDSNFTIVDIASYLMNQNFSYAFPAISRYLESNDKEEYQFLINDLIKISMMNEDTDFITPITTLMYMGLDKFKLDTMSYVDKFYESFEQNRFDEASIYLDIIGKSRNLEPNLVLPSKIGELLNNVNERLDENDEMGESDSSHPFIGQYLQTVNKEDILPSKLPAKRKK